MEDPTMDRAIKASQLQNNMQLFTEIVTPYKEKKAKVEVALQLDKTVSANVSFVLPQNVSFPDYMRFNKSVETFIKEVSKFEVVQEMRELVVTHETVNGDTETLNLSIVFILK